MENNKNPLRTLYIVQVATIIILALLLIQAVLPFFGIMPVGKQYHLQGSPPGAGGNGGYTAPSNQQAHDIDSTSRVLMLSPQILK